MLKAFVREFPTVHLVIGVAGNLVFFVGSVLFVWHTTELLAIWLFIAGSFGMLLGDIGQALYLHERHRLNGAPGRQQDRLR
ncbi:MULTISPECIES: YrhK family protein [unclassified Amycolatopsis]|uniref:YrhK family protein n=1 Tax=unclassified Amycolatopsis TaxID=2618356 RepID=UPI002E1DEB7E|nr:MULTISPECIES: YrhK family protein [unclassified Amycolatopsis]